MKARSAVSELDQHGDAPATKGFEAGGLLHDLYLEAFGLSENLQNFTRAGAFDNGDGKLLRTSFAERETESKSEEKRESKDPEECLWLTNELAETSECQFDNGGSDRRVRFQCSVCRVVLIVER